MWMLKYYCCDDIPLVVDAAVEIDHDHDYDETAADDDDGTVDYS